MIFLLAVGFCRGGILSENYIFVSSGISSQWDFVAVRNCRVGNCRVGNCRSEKLSEWEIFAVRYSRGEKLSRGKLSGEIMSSEKLSQ